MKELLFYVLIGLVTVKVLVEGWRRGGESKIKQIIFKEKISVTVRNL